MLWYKAWIDTRWRFAIGIGLLACGAGLTVFGYPRIVRLVAAAPPIDDTTDLGRRVQELVQLSRGFRGYVWTQWFRQSAMQLAVLFAVLLGSGGLLTYGGGELYTLSLPASRKDLLFVRAAAGLGELLLLAFVPSVVIVLTAPAIGEYYGIASALAHATCLFAACGAFFSLALLLSTSYSDVWRPMLITLATAFVVALAEMRVPSFAPYSPLRLMIGETYFRTGHVPWLGIAAASALSAGLIYGASINIARRDY